MASSLRIATVSYVDDNFGDNLIGTSFLALLEVALENYGLDSDDYELAPLSLKGFDESQLERCDAIFFAGGGLFGQSYLGFYDYRGSRRAWDSCGVLLDGLEQYGCRRWSSRRYSPDRE